VLAQFAGTSLWFVGNAVLPDIQSQLQLGGSALGNMTSIVQFGFISGTLLFALFSIADRFPASKVFFVSCLVASLANACIAWLVKDAWSLMLFRFITGFFLAGIYPVGMKIASDWYEKGLGHALGWLVGALVLGTAFPYLLRGSLHDLEWRYIILFTSLFAFAGGMLILFFVPVGPYRKQAQAFNPANMIRAFKSKQFRSAAFGYFGHMWELYSFWTFVPVMIAINNEAQQASTNTALWSFIIIGSGAVSCVAGGYLSKFAGSKKVASLSLFISGACCLLSVVCLRSTTPVFLFFMLIWGLTVVSDSPQFSALVAQTAPAEYKGTALTFVTSIGFAITIVSIQLIGWLFNDKSAAHNTFLLLAPGPVLGLIAFLWPGRPGKR